MDEEKLLKRRKKAQRENNESAIISCCTDLANLYVESGRYDFAIEEFTLLAATYDKQNKRLEYAVVQRGIGEAYSELRNFEVALQHLKIYYGIVKELNNKLEVQRALATIGNTYLTCYSENQNHDHLMSAYNFFMKSLKVCENLNSEASKVEIADMSARLFANLGLVQTEMGYFDKAIELINKSIALCKSNDLYEQLQRSYMSLACTLEKNDDSKTALQQYNLAVETAKKLRDKPTLLATALVSKSEVLIKLGDFHGAKGTLLKAYKLKIPNAEERNNIEKKLRVVASICKKEDKLLTTKDTDYKTLKLLYEKMGDCACELKNFQKALGYYEKMLECGKKANISDMELATCYYSLAETYKDNGRFKEAVDNFEKEMELCDALKDKLNTLSKIADTKETSEAPVSEIQDVYMRAINMCKEEENLHEQGRMLKRFILFLRRQNKHSEAFTYQQQLDKLNYNSSDSESETSDAQGSIVGGDINLDEITDVSEDSDSETFAISKQSRRRKKYFKRNLKGETPLHTACIHNKLNGVRILLEQGHPINVRDNCGWLPLHEACNRGHLEIVKLLLEKGAAINDRGGVKCEGLTPLHDAASNGHLEVVQLLLNKGANPLAKTDGGETVLSYLTTWRANRQLNEEYQALYESIIAQITQLLEKAGQQSEDQAPLVTDEEKSPHFDDSRRSTRIGLENEDSSDAPNINIAKDYVSVMDSLRHRTRSPKKTTARNIVSKRPALIEMDDTADDWLEDDVGKSWKKRKTNSPPKLENVHPSSSKKSESRALSRRSSNHSNVIDSDEEDFQMDLENDRSLENNYYDPLNIPTTSRALDHQSPVKSTTGFKKRKHQAKLTSFGHTRSFVEADSTCSPKASTKSGFDSHRKSLPKQPSFDAGPEVPVLDSMLSVDVRIDEKLYRVPVLSSQINTKSIKWLATEAASRYARKEYMIPTLELETKNGAILADDDLVSLLFPLGTSQAEEVKARIVKWNIPPLINRYKEACQNVGVEPSSEVSQILQELSVVLDLSNKGLTGTILAPLCKVLNRQTNLLELNLSGNFLTNECVELLGSSLSSFENMYKLNLNCTGLSSETLQILANKLSGVGYKVSHLDLSDNMLSDQSFHSLALITRCFKLKQLNLSCNKYSKDLFTYSFNESVSLNLDHIEEFDISDNSLSNDALIRILSWLKPCSLKELNLSRNCISHGFLRELLITWGEIDDFKLLTLKLSRCYVHDSDLFDLLRLTRALQNLDLSYNDELTSISLRRLLQVDAIKNLALHGCKNIFKYFTELSKYIDQPLSDYEGKTIKLSLDLEKNYTEHEQLVKMWKDLYGDRVQLEQSSRLLCLSVLNKELQ